MHYAHALSIAHAQTGSAREHLPRYQNTTSPDKLECVRARRFFDIAGICHISVRASRWFHTETKKPKMNPHVIPLPLSLSPVRPLLWLSPLGIAE